MSEFCILQMRWRIRTRWSRSVFFEMSIFKRDALICLVLQKIKIKEQPTKTERITPVVQIRKKLLGFRMGWENVPILLRVEFPRSSTQEAFVRWYSYWYLGAMSIEGENSDEFWQSVYHRKFFGGNLWPHGTFFVANAWISGIKRTFLSSQVLGRWRQI